METYEQLKAQYDRTFAEHRLEMVLSNSDFRGYYLRPKEGGRINSVLILFTPEGITITGDHAPRRNGVCSDFGYDLPWFSSPKGAEYLAVKFGLERVWQEALGRAYVEERLNELRQQEAEEEAIEPWRELLEKFTWNDVDAHSFYEVLQEQAIDEWYMVAVGYDPQTMANLAAIQHAFARLMGEANKEVSKQPEVQQA